MSKTQRFVKYTSSILLTALLAQGSLAHAQEVYTVQAGDSLYTIAQVYGVSVDDLMAWNGLASDYLDVGDQLYIENPGQGQAATEEVATAPEATANSGYHTVSAGENLWDLSMYYGTSVQAIIDANGLTSDYLNVGDQLLIAPGSPADNNYDPIYNGGPVKADKQSETAPANDTGKSSLVTPQEGGAVHTVQAGDNLYNIALAYGVTVQDLYTWNNLSSDYLDIGDQLVVNPAGPVQTSEEVTVEESDGSQKKIDLAKLPEQYRPKTHKVKAGDNLWRIAQEYKVSAESIRTWNDMADNDNSLTIGQEIYVSNPALLPEVHQVEEGEDLTKIAETYLTNKEAILKWNDLTSEDQVSIGDYLLVSNPEPETHQVEPGQTLEAIADQYEVTVQDLREWNKIPANGEIVNGLLIVSNPHQ